MTRSHSDTGPSQPSPPGLQPVSGARAGAFLIVFAIGLAAFYHSSLDDWFFHDDFIFLERSVVSSPSDAIALFSLERNQRGLDETSHAYRPLATNVYFAIVQYAFGIDSLAFHSCNLLTLTALTTVLAVLLCVLGVGWWIAFAVAAAYAMASFNFETQLWISVFQELSMALLAAAAVMLHVRSERPTALARAAVLVLFAAALLCKEMAIALPFVLIAWQLVVRRSGLGAAFASTRTLWIAAAGYLALRLGAMPIAADGPYAYQVGAFAFGNAWTYLDWTLLGFGANSGWVGYGLVPAILVAGFAIATPPSRRLIVFGALWFAIALGPVLFLPNHSYRYYLVFPAIGFTIALAVALDTLMARVRAPALRAGLPLALVLAFALVGQPRFDRAEARRARQTERGRAIATQLMALHPSLPDHTRIFLAVPGNFALDRFIKGDGAVFRALYRNPTLRAARFTPQAFAESGHRDLAPPLGFALGDDGMLRRHPRGRAPARSADAPKKAVEAREHD